MTCTMYESFLMKGGFGYWMKYKRLQNNYRDRAYSLTRGALWTKNIKWEIFLIMEEEH